MTERTGARRSRRWAAPARAAAVAAVAGTALLTVACGGGRPASTAVSNGTNEKPLQQSLAFARCMRAHGAPDYPDPSSSGGFVQNPSNTADFKAPASARQACGHLLPKKTLAPAQQASANRANLALAVCMHRHGYPNFPDSWGGGIHVGQFTSLGIDVFSPRFQTAMKTCGWH